jgi:cytoskeleton protein RodZ
MNPERADKPVPDNQGNPGKTLAAQREAMGWTVEQVADQLKLAVRQVQALEEGDLANLPPPAVVRGFVRAYAKVVKLDAAPLVAQIELNSPAPDTTPTAIRRDKPTSFSQTRFPSNGKRASKLPLGLIGIAVLAIGAGAAAWHFGVVPAGLFNGTAASTSSSASTPDATVTVLPPPVQGPIAPNSVGAVGSAGVVDAKPADAHPPVISNAVPLISVPPVTTPGEPAGVAHNTPAGIAPVAGTTPSGAIGATGANGTNGTTAAAAATAAAPNALIISVREDSWIEVRPVKKGRALFSRMVKAGTIESITVAEPATLIVGKPGAVDATLRGVTVPLASLPPGRVARVPLQ